MTLPEWAKRKVDLDPDQPSHAQVRSAFIDLYDWYEIKSGMGCWARLADGSYAIVDGVKKQPEGGNEHGNA